MGYITVETNVMVEGGIYEVVTNSGRIYEKVIFMGRTDWLGRPVLLFRDFDLKEEIQINPSYVESIRRLNLPIEMLNEDQDGEGF